jgi:hypothetical protein
MLRDISSTGHFGRAKEYVINAFHTNYFVSRGEVMANILHLPKTWRKISMALI